MPIEIVIKSLIAGLIASFACGCGALPVMFGRAANLAKHAGLGYGVGWTFLVWGALNGLYQWVGLATAPIWR